VIRVLVWDAAGYFLSFFRSLVMRERLSGSEPRGHVLRRALALMAAAVAVLAGSPYRAEAFHWTGRYTAYGPNVLGNESYSEVTNTYDDYVVPFTPRLVWGNGYYSGVDTYFYADMTLNDNGTSTYYTEVSDIWGWGQGPDSGACIATETGTLDCFAGVHGDYSYHASNDGNLTWGFSTSVDAYITQTDSTHFSGYPEIDVGYGGFVLSISGGVDFTNAPDSVFEVDWEFVVPY
jgi:hypothetical protein